MEAAIQWEQGKGLPYSGLGGGGGIVALTTADLVHTVLAFAQLLSLDFLSWNRQASLAVKHVESDFRELWVGECGN